MGSQASQSSRPVFIIGSPRSGTSILTWAVGQHPNVLLTEESNWLGWFTTHAAAAHALGSARALRSQLSALGLTRGDFLSGLGAAIDRMVLGGRSYVEQASHAAAQSSTQQALSEFAISRDTRDPKARWVDGTPENSLQICALLALFPQARFVHILRDADEVAASLLAFRDELGHRVVANAEAAYAYWLRTVQACITAEDVLGPEVILRVRHADMVANGEQVLRRILDFLGEPFAPTCLDPLRHRINSSFAGSVMPRAHPGENSSVIMQARRLSAQWLATPQSANGNPAAREQWQTGFAMSVQYALTLEGNWEIAQAMLVKRRQTLDACGMLLAAQWLCALTLWLILGGTAFLVWLGVATGAVLIYAWMRRTGWRDFASRLLGANKATLDETHKVVG